MESDIDENIVATHSRSITKQGKAVDDGESNDDVNKNINVNMNIESSSSECITSESDEEIIIESCSEIDEEGVYFKIKDLASHDSCTGDSNEHHVVDFQANVDNSNSDSTTTNIIDLATPSSSSLQTARKFYGTTV